MPSKTTSKVKIEPAIKLYAARTVIVPELSFACIPHGITANLNGKRQFILPLAGVFMELHLLISAELITTDGELVTHVFNLSGSRVRVGKGQTVSQLISF